MHIFKVLFLPSIRTDKTAVSFFPKLSSISNNKTSLDLFSNLAPLASLKTICRGMLILVKFTKNNFPLQLSFIFTKIQIVVSCEALHIWGTKWWKLCVYQWPWLYLFRHQDWPEPSLRTPPHPLDEWQATATTLWSTQTLAVLWSHLLHNRKTSVSNLVPQDSMMDIGHGLLWSQIGKQ